MNRVPSYRRHKASGQAIVTIKGKSYYLGPYADDDERTGSTSYREYLRLITEWQATGEWPEPPVRDLRQPNYRRHKASGQAVVRLSGKDVYLGKYGSSASKRLYRKLVTEWLASGGSASMVKSKDLTIVELLAAYLKHAKAYYGSARDSEYFHCKLTVRRIKAIYSTEPADSFGTVQFKALRDSLVREKLSRRYCNKIMKRVIRMFRWAASESLVPPTVYQSLCAVEPLKAGRTTARETACVKPVSNDIVELTLPHLPPVVQTMVKLQLLVGCRPSELCALKPRMIERSDAVWQVRLEKHKNAHRGKDRVLYFGPKAQAVVIPYLLRSEDQFLFSPQESERRRREAVHESRATPINCGNRPGYNHRTRTGAKISSNLKDHYTRSSYARAITRACRAAGVTQWSPNQLRHNAATAIRRAFGLEAAQIILGHSGADVTQLYAERDTNKAIEVALRIG